MSLSSDICRLQELHAAGALDDRAYARAKHRLLQQEGAGKPARAAPRRRGLFRSVRRGSA